MSYSFWTSKPGKEFILMLVYGVLMWLSGYVWGRWI